jgi:hypothetical protein
MKVSGQLHAQAALPPERNLGTNWIGGWVDTIAGFEVLEKNKVPWPCREWNPGPKILQHKSRQYEINRNIVSKDAVAY